MKYRTNGAIGALLDEYEKAILELKATIKNLSPMALTAVVDLMTKDEDCRSIQKILSHVIGAGYSYIVQIRNSKGEQVKFPEYESYKDVSSYEKALDRMFKYNVQFFDDYSDINLDDYDTHRFTVRWGNIYDIEQLFEHAIVHILRHRRQIERFKLKLKV
jgi:uncharacterized damage-inducible protein DinB